MRREHPGLPAQASSGKMLPGFRKAAMEDRPGILSGELISGPSPQSRRVRHKHARQREKRGRGNRSRNCQTKPTHRLTVPKATSPPGAKHSPVASGTRLQLPGDDTEPRPSQNAARQRPQLSSFLRSSYFSTLRHPGGLEVGRGRDPKLSACCVRRWEGDGAGSRGRMGGRRGGERGGESK